MLKAIEQSKFVERNQCINCGSVHLNQLSSGRYRDEPLHGFLAADPWGENPLPFLEAATWSLAKCSDCSQVFHRLILDEEWNERRFSHWMSAEGIAEFENRLPGSKHARQFDAARSYVEHVLRVENLTRPIRGNEAVRLLDFGCGWGKFLETCKTFGFDAVGVDRSNPRAGGASIRIYPSLEAMGTRPKFHAITLFEVLEHLDQPASILDALSAMILPGGILILETPDCTGVTNIHTHYDYLKVHPLEHINAFTHSTLKSIAERYGFSQIPKGPAHVSSQVLRVLKREVKHAIGKADSSTQLYLRKL